MWAHYERDRKGDPHLLVLTSDEHSIELAEGDWVEEQHWVRFARDPVRSRGRVPMSTPAEVIAVHYPEYVSQSCLCGVKVANAAVWAVHLEDALTEAGYEVTLTPKAKTAQIDAEVLKTYADPGWHDEEVRHHGLDFGQFYGEQP
jgi:hypothetical protein